MKNLSDKIKKGYLLCALGASITMQLVMASVFLKAYLFGNGKITVFINTIGEANLELLLFFIVLPGLVAIFVKNISDYKNYFWGVGK